METTNTTERPQIGQGCTVHGWTDASPYEIVAVSKSGKQITLRAMKAERDPTWTPEWVPGGFAGHVVNNRSQRWVITSDPDGRLIKATLRKTGRWCVAGCNTGVSLDGAYCFYDYNF